MNINKTIDENVMTLEIEGRLDTVSAPELETEVEAIPDDITKLVLDLENLEYISSAGLRVLLSAHKKMSLRDGMTVKHANELVMEVFEVTGFSDILDIEE